MKENNSIKKEQIDSYLNSLKEFLPNKLMTKTCQILYSKFGEDSKSINNDLKFLEILKKLGKNQLISLNLKGSDSWGPRISNHEIELLCEVLKNNTSLERLDLSKNDLDRSTPGRECMF